MQTEQTGFSLFIVVIILTIIGGSTVVGIHYFVQNALVDIEIESQESTRFFQDTSINLQRKLQERDQVYLDEIEF